MVADEGLLDLMGDRLKAFFHAEMEGDNVLLIGDEAEWQDW